MRKKSTKHKATKKHPDMIVIRRTIIFLGILSAIAFLGVASFTQGRMVLAQQTENKHPEKNDTKIVLITQNSLDTTSSNPAIVATDGLNKWFLYNDTNDTIDNTLGTFVLGPTTPLYGKGSVQFTLGASPFNRKNIATFQFSGIALASISNMSFGTYSHSGIASGNEDPFLNFNIDFSGSSSAFQKRLVFVPSQNGIVIQDTWQKWETVASGPAQWTWSGYASNGNKWPDNNTNAYRTWTDIVTAFPHARLLPVGGWLGIRVGEPGPTNYTANVDFFSITKAHKTTIFNFDPAPATPSATPTPKKKDCDKDGWRAFTNPTFKNQGQCIDFMEHQEKTSTPSGKNK